MGINEIVYCCKDNPKLLDELLVNYAITELDYEKAKMIIADPELCALACEKYLQGIEGAKDISPSIPLKRKTKKSKKKLLSGLIGVAVVGVIFVAYREVTAKTVDLNGNVIIKMNEEAYSGQADVNDIEYFSNVDYYRTDGEYGDMLTKFETKGLSKEEAKSLVPKYNEETSTYLNGLNFVPIVSKSEGIANGDEIKVTFKYDRGYAFKHNLRVLGKKQTFKIDSLREYVDENNYQSADMSMLKDLCDNNLRQSDMEKEMSASDTVHLSNLTPCYIAKEKDVQNDELMLYRSITSTKTLQGQVSEDDYDLGIPLKGYIKDNKYHVVYANPSKVTLEGLRDPKYFTEGYMKPTEDKYYIAEVK